MSLSSVSLLADTQILSYLTIIVCCFTLNSNWCNVDAILRLGWNGKNTYCVHDINIVQIIKIPAYMCISIPANMEQLSVVVGHQHDYFVFNLSSQVGILMQNQSRWWVQWWNPNCKRNSSMAEENQEQLREIFIYFLLYQCGWWTIH